MTTPICHPSTLEMNPLCCIAPVLINQDQANSVAAILPGQFQLGINVSAEVVNCPKLSLLPQVSSVKIPNWTEYQPRWTTTAKIQLWKWEIWRHALAIALWLGFICLPKHFSPLLILEFSATKQNFFYSKEFWNFFWWRHSSLPIQLWWKRKRIWEVGEKKKKWRRNKKGKKIGLITWIN